MKWLSSEFSNRNPGRDSIFGWSKKVWVCFCDKFLELNWKNWIKKIFFVKNSCLSAKKKFPTFFYDLASLRKRKLLFFGLLFKLNTNSGIIFPLCVQAKTKLNSNKVDSDLIQLRVLFLLDKGIGFKQWCTSIHTSSPRIMWIFIYLSVWLFRFPDSQTCRNLTSRPFVWSYW